MRSDQTQQLVANVIAALLTLVTQFVVILLNDLGVA